MRCPYTDAAGHAMPGAPFPTRSARVSALPISRPMVAALALGTLLVGCAAPPPPPPAPPPPPPPHLGPPQAANCTASPVNLPDGGSGTATISLSNDGGYCAVSLTDAAGQPFDAGIEPVQPAHGTAVIVKYAGKTSIEYVPVGGYAGSDAFTVKLILKGQPGYTTLNVAVTVLGGPPAAGNPPPPTEHKQFHRG